MNSRRMPRRAARRSSTSTACGSSAVSGPRSQRHLSVQIARGTHHRTARPVRLRQDHPDAQRSSAPRSSRRAPSRCSGHPAGSAPLRAPASATCTQDPTIYDDLRVIDNVRYFARAVRHLGRTRRPTTRSPPSGSTTTEPPCAATCPAGSAPGRRWPARWSSQPDLLGARRTHRRPGPGAARRPVGTVPPAGAARHDAAGVQPRHGRGRPLRRPAADARRPPARAHHPDPATRGHRMSRHWRKRFCHHPAQQPRPQAEPAEPAGLPGHHRRGSCGSSPPTTAASR